MATVENVRLGITATTAKPGFSDITYSYELNPDESDCAEKREFSVTASLWGEDMLDDDVLAVDLDQHKVRFDNQGPCNPIRTERMFEVETKLLDEDLVGDDEVYLIVEARSGSSDEPAGEHRASGKSNVVIGDF